MERVLGRRRLFGKHFFFPLQLKPFYNQAVKLHVHWFVQDQKTNQWLSGGARAYGYAARHSRPKWEASGYINGPFAAASQISLKEVTDGERSTRSISQRTKVTIVTKYVPFRYFTRTGSKTLVWEQVQSRRAMTWNDSTPRLMWE